VAAVCVHGAWARLVRERLAGSAVRSCAVVSFPHGAMCPAAKAAEARLAVEDGAEELDMVMALGRARAGEWEQVRDDVAAVTRAVPVPVKVIVEAAALAPVELALACLVSVEGGAAFVKTSTGFHPAGGAREADVRLMRLAVGEQAGVKASGGIRTAEQARRMLLAGANRIGASASAAIAGG
jgi:deoxyribose-phosphate aldolase